MPISNMARPSNVVGMYKRLRVWLLPLGSKVTADLRGDSLREPVTTNLQRMGPNGEGPFYKTVLAQLQRSGDPKTEQVGGTRFHVHP